MTFNRTLRSLMMTTCLVAGLAGTASAQQYAQDQDDGVYTSGYSGPMGPNVQKAFGVDQMAPAPAPMMPAAHAQPGVISDPQQIRDCLCMQTRYEMLNNDVSTKQAAYDQGKARMSSLQDQIAAAKAGPSPSPAQIDQIRQLSQSRIETQNQLDMQDIPDLQKATNTYNQAVGSFTQMCGGKSYDTEVMGRVKTGLVCKGG